MTTAPTHRVFRAVVSTLKGGPGKTTSTMMTAFALVARGYTVLVIEADTKTQGVTDWCNLVTQAGAMPPNLRVAIWRGQDFDGPLGKFARAAEGEHDPDVVLVDTGGEHPDVFMSAGLYAQRLISPVGAQKGELRRVFATVEKAAEIDAESELRMSILLTRVESPGKGMARDARQYLDGTLAEYEEQQGVPEYTREGHDLYVHTAEIRRDYGTYGDVWGTIPNDLGTYADFAAELAAEINAVEGVQV